MKIGIVGLPNVGKSTLFKTLTKKNVDISNYPFCTIEPNVGVVEVPDKRLDDLAKMSQTQKTVYAVTEFVDIAGLVKGASTGEGLGNKFLANIREVDAIVHVVRVFESTTITHVHNKINPEDDIEIINTELILADLETVRKTIMRLERDAKSKNKEAILKLDLVKKIDEILNSGTMACEIKSHYDMEKFKDPEKNILREMALLTMKPMLYVFNTVDPDKKLNEKLEKLHHVKLDIKTEEDINDLSEAEIQELGLTAKINNLITESYTLLGLMTYFTTGEKESRAWTIKQGSTAPEAGAAIHTDFKEKFIRADLISWSELLKYGSWSKARETGAVRTVGKDYIVSDGDVMEFKV